MIFVPCRQLDGQTSLKKRQFVIIYQYTISQDTEKTSLTLKRPTLNHVKFLKKKNIRTSNFFFIELFGLCQTAIS